MPRLLPRLSFANLISMLALFVALGGFAYAAVSLPQNSVGAAQLRRNAVRAAKIAPQSVGIRKLGSGIQRKLDKRNGRVSAGPRGAVGPRGPRGPGAVRLNFSEDASASPVPTTIGTIGGLTIRAACQDTAGATSIAFSIHSKKAAVIEENFQNDTGADPHTPGTPSSGNLEINIPAGNTVLGGPPGVPTGTYFRTIASLIYTSAGKTASINLAELTDGTTAHCTANGVGVPAG